LSKVIIGYKLKKELDSYKKGEKFLFGIDSDGITSYVHAPNKDSDLVPEWLCNSLRDYFQPIKGSIRQIKKINKKRQLNELKETLRYDFFDD
jgi:hypothetical protein